MEGYLARSRSDRRPDEATYLYELMEAHGRVAFAAVFASAMASAAALAMEYAFAGLPDSPAREFIRQIIPYMVERTV